MIESRMTLWEWANDGHRVIDEPQEVLIQCTYCYAEPMSPKRLGNHQRTKHDIASTNPASVRRRLSRERARGVVKTVVPKNTPLPAVPGIVPHRPLRGNPKLIDPGKQERLRKELLYLIQSDFAPRFDVSPSAIVECMRTILDRNLQPPPSKLRSVPLGDIQL